jgi:hypothetical protein
MAEALPGCDVYTDAAQCLTLRLADGESKSRLEWILSPGKWDARLGPLAAILELFPADEYFLGCIAHIAHEDLYFEEVALDINDLDASAIIETGLGIIVAYHNADHSLLEL